MWGGVAERAQLEDLWGQAQDGSLRLALISGEAGVGKTRLATHLALAAHGQGATVLYGRCDEDLGVPYQPWAQALRHLVAEAPQPLLRAHVERHGGELRGWRRRWASVSQTCLLRARAIRRQSATSCTPPPRACWRRRAGRSRSC